MATVKGRWRFNNVITAMSGQQQVVFTIPDADLSASLKNGQFVTMSNGIYIDNGERDDLLYIGVDSASTAYVGKISYVGASSTWNTVTTQAVSLQCVDFGTTEQTVSDDFYSWLTENATQLKVTDLTNTAWYVPSGWIAEEGYGEFNVNYTWSISDYDDHGVLFIGYDPTPEPFANHITDSYLNAIGNTRGFTISITGGTDATNTKLIAWLSTYGVQLKVTDLRNTTWNIPAGWEAEAEYGTYVLYCRVIADTIGVEVLANPLSFKIGYSKSGTAHANTVQIYNGYDGSSAGIGNNYGLTIDIYGGTDTTNPKLIAWLSQYGELQTAETTDIQITYNGQKIATLAEGQIGVIMCDGKIAATDISIVFGLDGKITYNGIDTSVQAGKTATLACAKKKMESDVVVSVINGSGYTVNYERVGNSWDADTSLYIHFIDDAPKADLQGISQQTFYNADYLECSASDDTYAVNYYGTEYSMGIAVTTPRIFYFTTDSVVTYERYGNGYGWYINIMSASGDSGAGVPLILFTIDGHLYQAERGMTWMELGESEYNVFGVEAPASAGNVYVDGKPIFIESGCTVEDMSSEFAVTGADLIVANKAYYRMVGDF